MTYINPTTDFAFKKIFGSDESHGILISFLNGILYGGELIITDLVILDPYQAPRIEGFKSSYLDVKAKLSTGESDGTEPSPAIRAARQRRSPAIIS